MKNQDMVLEFDLEPEPTRKAKKAAGKVLVSPFTVLVDSREQLDLEKLRPYFNADDLAKALNAAVRAGLRDCRGARIVQEANTMVR